MSFYPDWSSKRVLLLGFGAEGRASLHYSVKCRAREIAIADQAEEVALTPSESQLVRHRFTGKHWLEGIYDFDVVVRSPGVSLRHINEVSRRAPQTVVTSGTEIFLQHHRDNTIGVTGTKGKSTTSSLIHHMLKLAKRDSILGGNIGLPALNLLDKETTHYVLELSSYQLADVRHSPRVSVFLNLYPEHLDHHGDFNQYGEAKANITRFQRARDRLVVPTDSEIIHRLTASTSAERVFWGSADGSAWVDDNFFYYRCEQGTAHKVCSVTSPLLKGPGNQRNILAALAALSDLSIPETILADAISSFNPLPHRLETVGTAHGVTFINDSISTVPEATINALETFGPLVQTVILGGFDRGVSFDGLADYLMHTDVQTVLLFPPSGARIALALRQHPLFDSRQPALVEVSTMQEAVLHASQCTSPASVCLLSPASPSFPLFKNFEERGLAFRAAVLGLRDTLPSE